jgi:hypothetical protein
MVKFDTTTTVEAPMTPSAVVVRNRFWPVVWPASTNTVVLTTQMLSPRVMVRPVAPELTLPTAAPRVPEYCVTSNVPPADR